MCSGGAVCAVEELFVQGHRGVPVCLQPAGEAGPPRPGQTALPGQGTGLSSSPGTRLKLSQVEKAYRKMEQALQA